MNRRNQFRRHPLAAAAAFALLAAGAVGPQRSLAGAGWGDTTNPSYPSGKLRSYWANSPSGMYPLGACFDLAGNAIAAAPLPASCDSGGFVDPATGLSLGLRKFVDTLPGLTASAANNLGNYIPVAVPDTSSYPDADYYEIAAVEFTQKMHSDMPGASHLRGYVQIDPAATDAAAGLSNGAVAPAGSKAIALTNSDGSPVRISRPDGAGGFRTVQAYGVEKPFYLGPTIVATQGRPTRVKYYNGLPTGRADATGRHGDINLPVDETLPGAGLGPEGKVKYTQNRTLIHLHGGDNPWISDGTPHQWITPADETDTANPKSVAAEATAAGVAAAPFLRGASALNVPDMADPGPGAMTYYFPNGLSARLMFYHDHSFGLTRLNVYSGLAAGYKLQDARDLALSAPGGALDGVPDIPLIILDMSFVPTNIAQQDAKWDPIYWGAPGDLWYGHVYETNQDPKSADGTNAVGRWDWGPFFWPVFPSAMDLPTGEHVIYNPALAAAGTMFATAAPRLSWTNAQTAGTLEGPSVLGLSEVTTTPETFNDTPIVNGVAYPTITVDPKAYRFRILNASNDRMFNLGLYIAADAATVDPLNPYVNASNPSLAPQICDGTESATANCSEVRMVPFSSPNSPTITTFNCPADGLTPASTSYPVRFPCAGGLMGTGWGSADNRPGGVPDPTTAGPNIHLIGNEAGFLAVPLDIPSTPTNYEYNKRSVTVLNVLEKGLYLGTAGRADVVIDFSKYAGKTLIVYNDAPAPMPASDPRIDYYTGSGDQTGAGGAPNPMPGYGPNTRTVMQIKVSMNGAQTPFDFAKLDAAVQANYLAGQQEPPIVPQTAYTPFGYASDTFARIYTGSIYLQNYQPLSFTTTGPLSYTPAPGTGPITFPDGTTLANAKCSTPAACQAEIDAIKAKGQISVPVGTPISAYVESKTIQELFDPTWGRMNATLGVELPFTSALTQTTIPLGYVDPATETVADGETQFWKITHNGVDSHPVHFHLVNVQVINRVGWDGTVKAPYPDEIGWKETVIMNPLEDIVVAVRARNPQMPFALMHSYRALDPSQPLGTPAGFTQVNPVTGNPATVVNTLSDFVNEYVWHCHILGHEENDFMRAVRFVPNEQLPDAPTLGNVALSGGAVQLNWIDPTPAGQAGTIGNPKNEIGFRIERAPIDGLGNVGAYAPVGGAKTYMQAGAYVPRVNTLANAVSGSDKAPLVGSDAMYRVVAVNAKGETASAAVKLTADVLAPSQLTVTADTATSISLAWADNALNETSYILGWTSGTAAGGSLTLPANATAGTASGLQANTAYAFTVAAVNAQSTASVGPVTGTTAPLAVSGLTATSAVAGAAADINLAWANGNPNIGTLGSVVISGTVGGVAITPVTLTGAAITAAGSAVIAGQPVATPYALTVTVNGAGGSASSSTTGLTAGAALAAATSTAAQLVSGVSASRATYQVIWTDNSRGETGYKIEVCQGVCTAISPVVATPPAANSPDRTWYNVSSLSTIAAPAAITGGQYAATVTNVAGPAQVPYTFRVTPLNGATAGPVGVQAPAVDLSVAPAAPTNLAVVSNAVGALTLNWTDAANNNASDTVQVSLARAVTALSARTPANSGFGYVTVPTVTFSAPQLAGGVTATAVATIDTNPFSATFSRVTALTITNPGSGYTAAPTVTISAPTGATAATRRTATATATISNYAWTTLAGATNGLSSSATATGLISGRGYQMQVRTNGSATNSAGSSAYVMSPIGFVK